MAALYLDEDVHQGATALLRNLGHSVVHARDHARGSKDDVQLLIAARANWVLVTCNRKDFVLLHDAWQHWSAAWDVQPQHAGILVVHNEWAPQTIAELVHGFFALDAPVANRLYRYVAERGWVERDARTAP